MKELVTITISKYLSMELARKLALAQWHSDAPEWIDRLRWFAFFERECFQVVAVDQAEQPVGRLQCIRNEEEPALWYYGDLFVLPSYRRMGIARRMVQAAMEFLTDRGANRLRCYVDPANEASIRLQTSLGFEEKPSRPFNLLIVDGQKMFERTLDGLLSVIPATVEDASYVGRMYAQNREQLHGEYIYMEEWKAVLSGADPYEENYLICRGYLPVAWLKLNGFESREDAWVSMLVVDARHHRQGIGTFAIRFAEDVCKNRGYARLHISTTKDNLPARNLYRKLGYAEQDGGDWLTYDKEW